MGAAPGRRVFDWPAALAAPGRMRWEIVVGCGGDGFGMPAPGSLPSPELELEPDPGSAVGFGTAGRLLSLLAGSPPGLEGRR